jgi:hypothetical protein
MWPCAGPLALTHPKLFPVTTLDVLMVQVDVAHSGEGMAFE